MRVKNQSKIGIFGGGQLARMLVIKGHELGLQMYVLSPSKEDPAAQVTSHWIQGDPNKSRDIKKFLSLVNLATFESEFFDGQLLHKHSKDLNTPIRPKPLTMHQIQDRLKQKQKLQKYDLPQAPFYKVNNKKDLLKAWSIFYTKGMVLKTRRFGYDGYGTFIFPPYSHQNNGEEIEAQIKKWNISFQNKEGFIAEAFQKFKRELSLIAARNYRGEICFFPLVETYQKESRCFWVKGPSQHKKLSPLKRKIKKYLEDIRYEGVIAFELFDMGKDLLINEIAPRVHNSGHYSLDALLPDQFTLHLLSILNQSLPCQPLELTSGYAMVNLLGGTQKQPHWTLHPKIKLHWYGKKENRVGRKMGHINATGPSAKKALQILLESERNFKL